MRDSQNRQYSKEWIQRDRPQQMYDKNINLFYDLVFKQNPIHNDSISNQFKEEFNIFLSNHKLSKIKGMHAFERRDVIHGCTQFIDDIYQRTGNSGVQVFENDYKYHWRLNNNIKYATLETLDSSKELIISLPFPAYGDIHPEMDEILDKCSAKNISVHIDAAWITAAQGIDFNFDHPAIKTVGFSLSKCGLGTDRIGIRYSRVKPEGAVTIMNDFNMTPKGLMHVGINFMKLIGPEYFWKTYNDQYYKVCADFNLTPTKCVHVAKDNGHIVGIRPLLRCQTNLPKPQSLS